MKSESETFFDEKPQERVKEESKAADAAMFDVRCLMFDVKTNKPEGTTSVHRGLPSTAGELRAESAFQR